MKNRLYSFRTGVLLTAVVLLFASCESLKFSFMKDDELVKGGVQAWNSDKASAAKAYWNAIKEPGLKAQWLGRLDQYDALEKSFDDLSNLPATPEAPLLAAWDSSLKALADFPPELKLPDTFKPRLVPVAKAIVEGRIQADKIPAAKDFMKTASDALGDKIEWAVQLQEIKDWEKSQATAAAYRALDKSLEKSTGDALAAARAQPQFDDQIAGYEAAIVTYTKAEATMNAQAKANGFKEGSALASLSDKYRRKRGEVRTEMEKTLRDRAYSFKERIGEEFARTPDGDKLGSMTLQDTLTFNETMKTNIESMQAEVIAFAAKYPKIIDKDMLKDVDDQKRALEDRITQVTAEVKQAQADAKVAAEIASRGKAVFPQMIGLFNPQPGTKGNDQKSRPGKFRGTLDGDAVYWWGFVSIEKNVLNDLVITVNDNRPVRVFNDNTLSGKKIEEKKLKDLVNRQYKVGNSWPVINAGAQLAGGRYFFEAGKGKEAKYSGDVVVYSSFIVRMR